MTLKLPIAIALSLTFTFAPLASAVAQQRRQMPAKPPAAPAVKPAPVPTPPPPTFDTLLAANSYRVYVEVRSVGQLIRSNAVNEILEPIMKLAAPPEEFRTVIKWLNAHADEVMTSRMLVTAWPASGTELPEAVIAIEFASPEEAAKFDQKLNNFLKKMLPPATPQSSPKPPGLMENSSEKEPYSVKLDIKTPAQAEQAEAQLPAYHMQQAGSLILITPRPLKLNKLRPAGSKLLSDDANFRTVRNRFNSESIFVFVNSSEIEKEEQEQRKKWEEQHKQAIAAANSPENQEAIAKATEEARKELEKAASEPPDPEEIVETETEIVGVAPTGQLKEAPPDPMPPALSLALGMIFSMGSISEAKWPEAVGVALSLESESFDLRALLVNKPGEKSDPIPFFPLLAPGPAIFSEAPAILPADTEMLVSFSLDLPHIYSVLAKPRDLQIVPTSGGTPPESSEFQPTMIGELEKRLKINIKDDLLPLLGSEVVVGIPLTEFGWIQPPPPPTSASPAPSSAPSSAPSPSASPATNTGDTTAEDQKKPSRFPVVVISVKDKEAMRTLLPKLVESVAFKGANSFAQTERREDTELVSYMNLLAYAFIGNYLVISPDAASTRHVVDSYLKHQTLAGDPHYKNYTRWQPRQSLGQIYISPVLMEGYRKWAQQPTSQIDDQTRAFLTRFSIVAQPVTYSLSNEGFGPMHELHLPKNLVLLLIAAAAGGMTVSQPDTTSEPEPTPAPTPPAKPFF
ncbi:MAG TPA: DUF3352 domain-containing protein [Pyrinomonadaceae bacterium]|nr:DUF3352 domain-containing protein [Pyrinomonadaceae bacterium]